MAIKEKKAVKGIVKLLARVGLIAWILVLGRFILFKHQWYVYENYFRDEYPAYTLLDGWKKSNVVPFRNIIDIMTRSDAYAFWIGNISGNIAGFIPVGFLLPLCSSKPVSFRTTLLLTGFASLCFELTQWVLGTGIMDIDDVLLNLAGGSIGYFCYKISMGKTKAVGKFH